MAVSAISGLGFNNYNSVSFEGTGVKKARREANAEARQVQTETPIAEQAPVSNSGQKMVTVPAATLAALLMVATPAMMSPQKAAAQSNTSTQVSSQAFPDCIQPAIIIENERRLPNPQNYINKWVMFKDGDTYSGVMLQSQRDGDNRYFYNVVYCMIDGEDSYIGNVAGFNMKQGYFVCRNQEGVVNIQAKGYYDTEQALNYIDRAFISSTNRSGLNNKLKF